ncbi:MAG: hypothetical protein N3A57_04995 [Negativicutes bacterium]|nr:hypothetical protein [Negativicutes bacterium]
MKLRPLWQKISSKKGWALAAALVLAFTAAGAVYAYTSDLCDGTGKGDRDGDRQARMATRLDKAVTDGVITAEQKDVLLKVHQVMSENRLKLRDAFWRRDVGQLISQGAISQDQADTALATMALVYGNQQAGPDRGKDGKGPKLDRQLQALVDNGTITADQKKTTLDVMAAVRKNHRSDGKDSGQDRTAGRLQHWQDSLGVMVSQGLISQDQANLALAAEQALADKGYLGGQGEGKKGKKGNRKGNDQ